MVFLYSQPFIFFRTCFPLGHSLRFTVPLSSICREGPELLMHQYNDHVDCETFIFTIACVSSASAGICPDRLGTFYLCSHLHFWVPEAG